MQIDLREILDIPKIQSITDAFYAATGIPSSIITTDGEILSGSGWQDACVHFHRKHPEASKACGYSDTLIRDGLLDGKKSIVYQCPNGLQDAAAPILVEGRHVANYFTGQFLFHTPSPEEWRFFEEQAERYGFDKEAYLKAISELPIIPEHRIDSIMEYLTQFAALIAESGYTNLQNERFARELNKSHDRLEKLVDARTASLDETNRELKKEIEHRKRAEARFKTFLSMIPDIFCIADIADINGYFKMINPAAQKLLGYSEEELLSKPFLEFVHPEDKEKTLAVIEEQLSQGATLLDFQNRYVCKDGSALWIEWTSHPLIDQGITFAVGRDCTERLKMEAALKESELWMRNIFNTLEEAVLVVSPERKILNANKAAREIFGYSSEELLEISTETLHKDRAYFLEFGKRIQEAFDQGVSAMFEFHGKRKNGEIFPTDHTVSLLKDESGKPLGIVSVVRDITERKNTEKSLREMMAELKRSNTELEQFAYIASHDLQEPLRAIAGFLQLLQDRFGDRLDETGHHYIERSVKASHRMQILINDILTLSRVNTRGNQFVVTDLNSVMERTLESLATAIEKTGARISYSAMPRAAVDASQIQSLLQNLIQNAIKYVGDEKPVIEIGCTEDDEMYRFHIKDNGIGIDPNFHERIFLVFQRLHTRREYPGTGLGLALCKKIIERHGGRIWVESKSGFGSVFYFTLPKKSDAS